MSCTLGVAASVRALSVVGKNVADFDVVKGITGHQGRLETT